MQEFVGYYGKSYVGKESQRKIKALSKTANLREYEFMV